MSQPVRAHYLTRQGNVWHYQRRRPKAFADVEPRQRIRFSLHTTNLAEAKLRAAEWTMRLEREWREAKARGVSLASQDAATRYAAATEIVSEAGLAYAAPQAMTDDELLGRLRRLILGEHPVEERKAVLGVIEKPRLSLMQGFDRFWAHIRDEWGPLSTDQQRIKRNIFLRAIASFEKAVGAIPLHDIERQHAFQFRTWWMKRLQDEGLKPNSGNRELDSIRRIIAVNFDLDLIERPNPFARIRLKDSRNRTRAPFETDFIRNGLLGSGALDGLPIELRLMIRMLVNTGMRPSEALGLEDADIDLDGDVPFVHVRQNKTRVLKTAHSERQLPLVGVSLKATQAVVAQGGWGKWAGKNVYATTVINKHFRDTGLVPDRNQSLYSLRHWFQDQLTKRDVVDRAQAQLMGHKFHRPKYGYGKDLSELREIIAAFAIG